MDNEDVPFIRQNKTIAAAIVLVGVVLLAAWLAFGRGSDDQSASSPAASRAKEVEPSPSTPVASDGKAAYDSACGLRGGSTAPLTQTPTDVKWSSENGWRLPSSATQGPGKKESKGQWSCFGHTPTGAALAAYVIPIRMATAPDFRSVIKGQTVPGVGQSTLLSKGSPNDSASPFAPRGVVVDSYTGTEATVSLVVSSPEMGEMTCSVNVQWFGGQKGDWKVRLESNGDSYTGCTQSAASSYVRWGD